MTTPADRKLLADTVTSLIAASSRSTSLSWDEPLWQALSAAGFTSIGQESDSEMASFAAATAVVTAAASGAAAVPLAEHLLLALPAWRIAKLSNAPDPAVPATLAFGNVRAERRGASWRLDGVVDDAPWASVSGLVLAVVSVNSQAGLAALPTGGLSIDTAVNIAGEPRGRISFDATEAAELQPLTEAEIAELRARYAFARAAQIAGALRRVLDLTVSYARQREQFGRPIFEFQLIRSHLAVMAGQVAATEAIVAAATDAAPESAQFGVLAAAAKVRAGTAVDVVTRLAHQVHGAIGLTQEYPLHYLTRRCWSWRDEGGSTNHWSRALAHDLLDADDLWSALSRH
jgi:acyl-CoA dehydrogenase